MNRLPLLLIFTFFIIASCKTKNKEYQAKAQEIEEVVEVIDEHTINMSVEFISEINKINTTEKLNYLRLDSLYKNGAEVNMLFEKKYKRKKLLNYVPIARHFVKKKHRVFTDQIRAIDVACAAYAKKEGSENRKREFELIEYLLTKNVDPNEEGMRGLNQIIESSLFYDNYKKVDRVLALYQDHGFDIESLDLSICESNLDMLEHLYNLGARYYDMKLVDFSSEIKDLHEHRAEFPDVNYDFSKIDGGDFPFLSDTTDLRMFLDFGMSPYHKTKDGTPLESGFYESPKKELLKILKKYR